MLFDKKPKLDPPALIAMRERLAPVDTSRFVLANPEDIDKFDYHWVQTSSRNMAQRMNGDGYTPVKRKELAVGTFYGDKTTELVVDGDLMLMKRPIERLIEERTQNDLYLTSGLKRRYDELEENALKDGVRVHQEVRVGDDESLVAPLEKGEKRIV